MLHPVFFFGSILIRGESFLQPNKIKHGKEPTTKFETSPIKHQKDRNKIAAWHQSGDRGGGSQKKAVEVDRIGPGR